MAESYSFFNSKDHDRVYNARHWADYFFPLFRSGVFNGNLQVVENGGMRVKISDGYAWIDGYLYHLTGGLILDLETASGNMNRIDNIVIRLDLTNRWVKGFAVRGSYYQGNAAAPERAVTSTIHELVIARISIPAGATQITQDMIEDTRMNNDLCGWVVGTVKEIDYSQIYAQFTAYQKKKVDEVDKWQRLEEAALTAWVTQLKKEKTEQLQRLLTDFENLKDNAQTEFEDWYTGNTTNWEEEWTTWFNNLKEQVTDNAVTNLQSQIGILGNLSTTAKSNLVAAVNEVKNSSGVTGIKGNAETSYRKGNVNITPANIGLGNVNNTSDADKNVASAARVSLPRVIKNAAYSPGANRVVFEEFGNTSQNLPSANWYHIITSQGSDGSYVTQLAIGMTSDDMFYRRKSGNTWTAWKKLAFIDSNVASATKATQDGEGSAIRDTYLRSHHALRRLESGEFTNDTISIPLALNHSFLLITREIAVSTDKIYGYRARMYTTPPVTKLTSSDPTLNTPTAANLCASTNAGVTLGTYNMIELPSISSDDKNTYLRYGITLKATSAYKVRYELFDLEPDYINQTLFKKPVTNNQIFNYEWKTVDYNGNNLSR